jgi:SHS2 domain-containing protein
MSYQELPHTADILVRVNASSVEELFSESVSALMNVLYGSDRKNKTTKEISLSSENIDNLLVEFLSEILFLSETERFVVSSCSVSVLGLSLHAQLTGEKFSQERHGMGTEVKGISYSGASVQKIAGGYQVDILLDV